MIEKLAALNEKFDRLTEMVSDPDIISRQSEWQKHVKARAEIEDVVMAYREYLAAEAAVKDAEAILADKGDPEMAELAEMEIEENKEKMERLTQEMKVLLLPKDPNDNKNVILEIRAGTGGEEAALFADDLYKMYLHYAEKHNWKTEIMNLSETDIGGIKEGVILIEGKGAYSRLKFESGVHRTESSQYRKLRPYPYQRRYCSRTAGGRRSRSGDQPQ